MRDKDGTSSEALFAGCLFIFLLFFLLIISSIPSHGQVAAAGWCVVTDQESEPINQPPDDSFPPQADESESTSPLGCDIGIGFSLYTHNRLAIVAVVGSESIGSGVAWILNPTAKSSTDHHPIMAIAIGLVTPYDSNGIGSDVQLAFGMTLSLRQGGAE